MCNPVFAQTGQPWWISRLWGNGNATTTNTTSNTNSNNNEGGETRSGSSTSN